MTDAQSHAALWPKPIRCSGCTSFPTNPNFLMCVGPQCHSWLVITLGHHVLPGQGGDCVQAQSHHLLVKPFHVTLPVYWQLWISPSLFCANDQKSARDIPKLSTRQRGGRNEGRRREREMRWNSNGEGENTEAENNAENASWEEMLGLSDNESGVERERGKQRKYGWLELQLQHTQTRKTQIFRDYDGLQPGGKKLI